MIVAERSGSFGMGSTYNADQHAGVGQMMSFRILQLDMNMTVKSVSSRLERRERDGVQDRVDHGCPQESAVWPCVCDFCVERFLFWVRCFTSGSAGSAEKQ